MISVGPGQETHRATCWNCLLEFDAVEAPWCSHDPKLPSKMCPSCGRCFCQASEKYKQDFWRRAPAPLLEELELLSRSKDRLGDILVHMGKLTTSQLLSAIVAQKSRTGEPTLAQVVREDGLVSEEDLEEALKERGGHPLTDTRGERYSTKLVCEGNDPVAILNYLLSLAGRRGASELHIEPKSDGVAVKYRIDGVGFRLDPLPKRFEADLVQRVFEIFRLDHGHPARPQRGRTTEKLVDGEFDLVAQTLPTAHGVSISIRFIDRANFIKDFTTLGFTLEDRMRLVGGLRQSFGLVLVTAPVFEGASTTAFSIMDFLIRAQRDVVSLESPVVWLMEGGRQVDVNEAETRVADVLRSAVSVRPDVVILFRAPDAETALLASQLASSLLVVCVMPAQSSAQAIASLIDMGVPRHLLAGALDTVTCQRLVRRICPICRESVEPPSPQHLAQRGIAAEDVTRMRFYKGKGCPSCNRVGYRGRQAIFEVLSASPEVVAGIANGLSAADVEVLARGSGMKLLRDRGIELVTQGVTTYEEFEGLRL
jgi:type II secretory ATPase GspE/PulE/Tfp pilus assembly ATPase PilB-like protein